MSSDDPRITQLARRLYLDDWAYDTWDSEGGDFKEPYFKRAAYLLAAADAVDPLRQPGSEWEHGYREGEQNGIDIGAAETVRRLSSPETVEAAALAICRSRRAAVGGDPPCPACSEYADVALAAVRSAVTGETE